MSRQYEVRMETQREACKVDRLQDAINLLNSRRRDVRPKSIPEVAEDLPKMPAMSSFTGKPSLSGMKAWLSSLGHSVSTSQASLFDAF